MRTAALAILPLVALVALEPALAGPSAGATVPVVAPGAVVRWAGPGLVGCERDGRRWAPLDGACWYPIDLGAQGELELVRRSSGGVAARRVRIGDYPYPTQRLEVEDRYVAPSAAELARIEREKQRVAALFALDTPRRFSLPLAAPLGELPGSSRFGVRRIFNDQPRSPHSGADFPAAAGTAVLAPAAGRVALAEEHFFAGKSVFLDHGDGLISMSFHLSEILVEAGDEIATGQTIGRVGATGRVTGPHLHFAVRWRGARVDPEVLLGRAAPVELN